MEKNAGVWIDSKEAIIISVNEDSPTTIKTIASGIETRIRFQGKNTRFGSFGNQYLTFEKKQRNRRDNQIAAFIKSILKELEQFDKFVIFGSSKMNTQLENEIYLDPILTSKCSGTNASNKLTKNQKVAWVLDYFKVNA
jgi:hypothetical protein